MFYKDLFIFWHMNKQEMLNKITEKRELSQLPKKDVKLALSHFERREVSDEEKIRLTRELLHKVFGAFGSKKLLSIKEKNSEWVLGKHVSTRERIPYYSEIYTKVLGGTKGKISIIDLGCGVNGFSCSYFKKLGFEVNYLGVEAVGQIADLANSYFKKQKIKGRVELLSLFEMDKIKMLVNKMPKPKIVFLFKTIDSLEMLKRDYSKKLLLEITPLVDKVVVSFATKSFNKRISFKAKRTWILSFIEREFKIIKDFEAGGERYLLFENK